VTDFIDPVLWPAFNVADMCIVLGVFGVLYLAESRR
jgi:lipoprotein signal peptidase